MFLYTTDDTSRSRVVFPGSREEGFCNLLGSSMMYQTDDTGGVPVTSPRLPLL